ncbi:MAG: hypothetical protein NDI94_01045 [Candidatus Woesearchaeota archaeon]|nr:hypothetical protein [Candidatus Woesearchaeota archaeon]
MDSLFDEEWEIFGNRHVGRFRDTKNAVEIQLDDSLLEFKRSIEGGNGIGIAINPYFSGFEERIRTCLADRTAEKGTSTYGSGIDANLLALANQHINDNRTDLTSGSVLTLTHPFYMHLSEWTQAEKNRHARSADNYLRDLMGVIAMAKEKQVDIILIETLHHYAAFSSLLLEEGYVSDVILTKFDQGYSLQPEKLDQLKRRIVYSGGSYNSACFEQHLKELNDRLAPPDNVWILNDLVLNGLCHRYITVAPSQVSFPYHSDLKPSQIITLNEFYSHMDA